MSFAHLDLAKDPHDRLAERRSDEDWLADRWADPESRVLVVAGSRIRPVDGSVVWTAPGLAPQGTRILLGEHDGRTWFADVVDPVDPVDPVETGEVPSEWVGLRAVLPYLGSGGDHQGSLVFHAVALAQWLGATRHCPRCGGPLAVRASGHELECQQCGRRQFPRTDPAVIMAIASGESGVEDERLLLGRQSAWPAGRFSTLAGFVEPGETLEDTVRREVREETGVVVGEVTYFGNQPWPFPASLMVGFIGLAETTEITVDGQEIEDARWFTRADLKVQAEAGELVLPGGVSISRSLVEHWYGGPLPGTW